MAGPRKKRVYKNKAVEKIMSNLGKIIFTIISICIITGSIVASVLTVYILNSINADDAIDLTNLKLDYTSIIYAQNKQTGDYYELQRIATGDNRIWVDYQNIPPKMVEALIAGEDKRFLQHTGVDWFRTFMAFVNQLVPFSDKSFGGSTITQQLVKNVTGDKAVRIDRKIREIFSALNVERRYSKEQVLEGYLNTVAFGNNNNGVQSAANMYFSKDVSKLSIAESCAILSITQNPTKYDPLKHPENNKLRREWFIGQMYSQGKITKEVYDATMTESANMKFTGELKQIINPEIQSYFVENCIEEVTNDLVSELGYTKEYAKSLIYRGGYKIYTTIDQDMQTYLEEKYANSKTFPRINNAEYPHSSFVIMDTNGKLLALVGDKGEKTGNMLYNYATHIQRQPGSTFKPISSYALAFENDMLNFSSMVEDSPIKLKDPTTQVEKDWPVNVYDKYLGKITVDEALQRSTNTIPVKLVESMGASKVFDFIKDSYGFTGVFDPNDRNLSSMALGGMTKGVSTLELAGAYQIFANGGLYTKPYSYTKVLDADDKVVLEKSIVPKRIISNETATVMNRLLQNVVDGRVYGRSNAKLTDIPMGGKTGTSSNDVDHWFMGFTPYYVAGVWLGYDTNISINYKPNPYPAMVLWKNVMAGLHTKLPAKDFEYNSSIVSAEYCIETGDLAGEKCTKRSMGYYKPSFVPPVCTSLHGAAAPPQDGTIVSGETASSSSGSSSSSTSGTSSSGSSASSSSSQSSSTSSSSKSSSSKSSSSSKNNNRP